MYIIKYANFECRRLQCLRNHLLPQPLRPPHIPPPLSPSQSRLLNLRTGRGRLPSPTMERSPSTKGMARNLQPKRPKRRKMIHLNHHHHHHHQPYPKITRNTNPILEPSVSLNLTPRASQRAARGIRKRSWREGEGERVEGFWICWQRTLRHSMESTYSTLTVRSALGRNLRPLPVQTTPTRNLGEPLCA